MASMLREGRTVRQGQAFKGRLSIPFRFPSRDTNLTSATVAVLQPRIALVIFEIREIVFKFILEEQPDLALLRANRHFYARFRPTSTSRSTYRRPGPHSTFSSHASRSEIVLRPSRRSGFAFGTTATSSNPSLDDSSTRSNDSCLFSFLTIDSYYDDLETYREKQAGVGSLLADLIAPSPPPRRHLYRALGRWCFLFLPRVRGRPRRLSRPVVQTRSPRGSFVRHHP